MGRFINADAFTSTGQGLLGNNMFAYCRNNPVCRKDISGNRDENAVCENSEENAEEEPFWKRFLGHMARQRKDGHTFSVGYVYGTTLGSSGGGKAGCIAVDNSYNFALQSSESLNVSVGTGASCGLSFTYTNADSVLDLEGSSSSYGFTLCGPLGISIDFITFTAATDPSKECFGISVAVLFGAEADVHAGNSYTKSYTKNNKKSWNPFAALQDWLFPD